MNDKIPTVEESKHHIETLVRFGLDLDERHYKKFIKPVFDKLERYEKAIKEAHSECLLEKPYKAHEILDDALEDGE